MSWRPLILIAFTGSLAVIQGWGSSETAQLSVASGVELPVAGSTHDVPAAMEQAAIARDGGDYASLFALSETPCDVIEDDALASLVKGPAAMIKSKAVWAACEYTWSAGSEIPHRLKIRIDPKQEFYFQAELEMTRDPSSRVGYSEDHAARADYVSYVDKGRQVIGISQAGKGALMIAFQPQATGELASELLEARACEAVEVARYLFDRYRSGPDPPEPAATCRCDATSSRETAVSAPLAPSD